MKANAQKAPEHYLHICMCFIKVIHPLKSNYVTKRELLGKSLIRTGKVLCITQCI